MSCQIPEAVKNFLEDLARRLHEDQGDNLVEVRLFGSYARGDARPDSDVDVLVVIQEGPRAVQEHIVDIMADVALDHDVPVGPLVMDMKLLKEHEASRSLLYRNLQSEGVVVWSQ